MTTLKTLILTLICNFIITSASAQEGSLAISTKVNPDKSVSFIAETSNTGTFTVILSFKDLINSSAGGSNIYKIKYNGQNFLTLRPTDKENGISYTYATSYIRGELNPKIDKDFIYSLPYTSGKKVKVGESNFVNAIYLGSTTPEDWKSYRFSTAQSDTVTAIRKGTVVAIKDIYEMNETGDQTFTSQVNEILIEHEDGTIATFRGFRKGILVKLAQIVFPGTPLGLSSKNSGNGQFNISLMLTYLKSVDFTKKQEAKETKSMYGFVTPYFYNLANSKEILTNNETYTVALPLDVLQKEMTKKEIKNLAKP